MPKAPQELSPEAQRVMVRGVREGKTTRMIAALIEQDCGETVPERTLARRISEWRAEQARLKAKQEDVDAIVKAMLANDATAADMAQALMMQAMVEDPERFKAGKGVYAAGLAAQELRLKERALAVKERAVAAIERRVKLLEEREARAVAALEDKSGTKTAEERVREIREIYNLPAVGVA